MFWLYCNVLLTIFSIKLLLLILTPDLWQWSPQTFFCPAVAATCSRSLQQSGKAKRTVRKHQVLMMLQFFYSPFFQLTCCFYFLCVFCGIEAHRPFFAPPLPPPTRVHFSRAAAQKERWENIKFWWCYSFFSQFFQLTCCFYSLHAVCGIDAHRLAFAPSLPPPTCIHFSRAAAQKERWEIIKFWWCYSFFSPFFQLNCCYHFLGRSVVFVPLCHMMWWEFDIFAFCFINLHSRLKHSVVSFSFRFLRVVLCLKNLGRG